MNKELLGDLICLEGKLCVMINALKDGQALADGHTVQRIDDIKKAVEKIIDREVHL